MWLPEVSYHYGPVHGGDDLAERQLLRRTGQDVTSPHPPFGAHEPRPLQGQEYLLQVGLREAGAQRDVPDRRRGATPVQGQRQKGSARVITARRHSHGPMVLGAAAEPEDRKCLGKFGWER